MSNSTQMKIGGATILVAITGFFIWGFVFDLFGHKIRFDPQTVGFFIWLLLGMFGAGYAYGGPRGGFRIAGRFAAMAALAVAIGVVRGAYR